MNTRGTAEGRWDSQREFALRIARVTTRALPDNEGVGLYFINQGAYDSPSLDLAGVGRVLDTVRPRGDTRIGTALKERILQPLVYNLLATRTLARPLLVTIITDGGPEPEAPGTLANVIVDCGQRLAQNG